MKNKRWKRKAKKIKGYCEWCPDCDSCNIQIEYCRISNFSGKPPCNTDVRIIEKIYKN